MQSNYEPYELISVVIPIYNAEKYLARCVESVLHQTYLNIEIILVDDGSEDASGKMCDNYALLDDRVRVIHQKNSGPTRARKNGVDAARGTYIAFADADDYCNPEWISSLYEIITREKVDFVHSGFYQNDMYVGCVKSEKVTLDSDNRFKVICDRLLGSNMDTVITPSLWSKLFSTELIKKSIETIDDGIMYGEDLLLVCQCMLQADSFYVLNESYYNYSLLDDSLSHKQNKVQIKNEIKLYIKLEEMLGEQAKFELASDTLNAFLLNHLYMGLNNYPGMQGTVMKYAIPSIADLYNKKIVLYGAGKVGVDYYVQIRKHQRCDLVAWVDKNAEKRNYDYCTVQSPEELMNLEYDIILIAIASESQSNMIIDELVKMGVDKKRILWKRPINLFEGWKNYERK